MSGREIVEQTEYLDIDQLTAKSPDLRLYRKRFEHYDSRIDPSTYSHKVLYFFYSVRDPVTQRI